MAKFSKTFWIANITELFERGAYYSMASLMVPYLEQVGLGNYWPMFLSGFLWFLVYFLPILSGTIADQVGFRRALLVAFALLVGGYAMMGVPVWSGSALLNPLTPDLFGLQMQRTGFCLLGQPLWQGLATADPILRGLVTCAPAVMVMLAIALLLIGLGGSVVKPCISGTVQKTAMGRATLAFAIFYLVINIGSLFGRGVGFVVRKLSDLSFIFAVALVCAAVAFWVVWWFYKDVAPVEPAAPDKRRRSIKEILFNMVRVLGNKRFALFLLASVGFWFLYNQIYTMIPRYLRNVVEVDSPVDIYTMANPLVIVAFQLLITKTFGRMKPVRSIIVGTIIITLSMAVNLLPIWLSGDLRDPWLGVPLASLVIVSTVALVAFGELFTSARMYEFIGSFAPKGQEGLFLGYVNLPMAFGALLSGLVGPLIFNEVMCHDAGKLPNGLLQLDPFYNSCGWLILMGIGLLSVLGVWLYHRWLERQVAGPTAESIKVV